ncbi:MAG: hypothetical protein FJ240_13040, partial [Nitrospira sp.]|nr:hypothetical protein [Nitrospira sp.]
NNGLSILPNVNLVSNIGFGQVGTHTAYRSRVANNKVETLKDIVHPLEIIADENADRFTFEYHFLGKIENSRFLLEDILNQLNSHNNDQAVTLFDHAIAIYPEVIGILYGKAIALARLGQNEKAIETLRHLLTVMPEHKKANLLINEILKASTSPKQTPQINPKTFGETEKQSVPELMEQALKALQKNDNNLAFNLLIQAKAQKISIQGLDYLRAIYFLRMNQLGDAREALREELRYFANNIDAINLLDQVLNAYPQRISTQLGDAEFNELLQVIRPYTMLSDARLFSLFSAAKKVCLENVTGNFIECGVAAGGSTALLAYTIQKYSKQPRLHYAFDSFEGMPTPTEHDTHDNQHAESTGWGTGTCAAPEDSVREICTKLGISDIVKTVKGYFQDTLPQMRNIVGPIAFLHMDADWYESTKVILHNLYDQIVHNGFIQVDDYGHWEGCKKAIHEFEALRNIKFDLHKIDYSGIWFSKP